MECHHMAGVEALWLVKILLSLQAPKKPGLLLSVTQFCRCWVKWRFERIRTEDWLSLQCGKVPSTRYNQTDSRLYTRRGGRRYQDRWSGGITDHFRCPDRKCCRKQHLRIVHAGGRHWSNQCEFLDRAGYLFPPSRSN